LKQISHDLVLKITLKKYNSEEIFEVVQMESLDKMLRWLKIDRILLFF